jgi:hypothetical protein
MQSARDHQVQDQPQLVSESKRDPFANAADFDDFLAFAFGNRWNGRAKQERAGDPCTNQCLLNDSCFQGVKVNSDVRQFRHTAKIGYFG